MRSEGTSSDGDAPPPRCWQCFRPTELCFCAAIPKVHNRTSIVILQHRRERFHPFNSARIVHQSLVRCRLFAEHNVDLARRFDSLTLSPKVGLLYPGDDAPLLDQLAPDQFPDQLVVLDGTWHHAKTLLRELPRLSTLPKYRLAPSSPGRYRIRREPHPQALSTLEATVAALQTLEPETPGLDGLSRVFDQMIDNQISVARSNWRHNRRRRRGAANVPRALVGELNNIVVAYGEREPGGQAVDHLDIRAPSAINKPAPVVWTAQRLVTGERFCCAIENPSLADNKFLERLELSRQQAQRAVSIDTFRQRWKSFLRPHDQLVVYHQRTARLLDHVGAAFAPTLVLKAIHVDGQTQRGTLDQYLRANDIHAPRVCGPRASRRLSAAIAVVEHWNRQKDASC